MESWSRHTLVWLNRFLDEGLLPVHNAWCEKCENIGKKISYPKNGDFIGLDENGNMLLKKSNDITIEKLIDCFAIALNGIKIDATKDPCKIT